MRAACRVLVCLVMCADAGLAHAAGHAAGHAAKGPAPACAVCVGMPRAALHMLVCFLVGAAFGGVPRVPRAACRVLVCWCAC